MRFARVRKAKVPGGGPNFSGSASHKNSARGNKSRRFLHCRGMQIDSLGIHQLHFGSIQATVSIPLYLRGRGLLHHAANHQLLALLHAQPLFYRPFAEPTVHQDQKLLIDCGTHGRGAIAFDCPALRRCAL